MDWYHVLNRGVDKRVVFLDDTDRARFIHDLFVFNDQRHALHPHMSDRKNERKQRKLLVHLHAFCLMGNHYHLLLSEAIPGGISFFMKKLNMGYAKYFNEKYDRSGALWQGKFKKKLLQRDAHFMYIPYYIHLNALDFSMPEWRTGNVTNIKKAFEQLENYQWSSHLDYLGKKNFPSITEREELASIIGTREKYKKEIGRIISNPDIAIGSQNIE
ncbi:MAG: transposase [Patescibacteria group bacterium]